MSQGYEAFCMADPWFYDTMMANESDRTASFAVARRPIPSIWQRAEHGDWLTFRTNANLPAQGWTVPVSACLDNAEKVLRTVWRYCVPRGIAFQFLRSPSALFARVSKYSGSGIGSELVTIFPTDDEQCETILNELSTSLAGEPHPCLVDAIRWENGPLHLRYGSFTPRECNDGGRIVPAMENERGRLVREQRGQGLTVPPWAVSPSFLQRCLDAQDDASVSGLPYTIDRTIQTSPGCGVYLAHDTRTGAPIVLKGARPHLGLDTFGNDAVQRLEHEHRVLRRLAGIPAVPEVRDLLWIDDYRVCIVEHVEGETVSRTVDRRNPLNNPSSEKEAFAAYAAWAIRVHDQIKAALEAIHERGIAFGALHPSSIVVGEDGSVILLDFESATTLEAATSPTLGNQGFAAPPGVTGDAVDEYALACLKIALFLPLTSLLWLHRPKVRQFAELIQRYFPIPHGYLDDAVETICPAPTTSRSRDITRHDPDSDLFTPERWPDLRDGIADAIVTSATPGRTDRLFPGDIQQFAGGGLGLAHGAAGVLHALAASGAKRFHDGEEWLMKKALTSPSNEHNRPGFLDGLAGVAFALDSLGHRNASFDVVDMSLHPGWESFGLDLATGVSGIGLNLLHLADRTGEPGLRLSAHKAIEITAFRAHDHDDTPASGVGLLHGSSGPALLLIRAYDECGEDAYLDLAADALRHDLAGHAARRGNRAAMPYLDSGSVGIGFVLDEYLARRYDEAFATTAARIRHGASKVLYRLPGLFSGRAGSLAFLATCARAQGIDPASDPDVRAQLRNLAWHALPYRDGVAFPGTALLRLSMDLATGTAGVLLAIASALNETSAPASLLGTTTETSTALRKHTTRPEVGHSGVGATR